MFCKGLPGIREDERKTPRMSLNSRCSGYQGSLRAQVKSQARKTLRSSEERCDRRSSRLSIDDKSCSSKVSPVSERPKNIDQDLTGKVKSMSSQSQLPNMMDCKLARKSYQASSS